MPQRDLLPPPYETILIYAAYGWAKANGFKNTMGRPRLPERDVWVPLFYGLAATDDGLREIQVHAEAGAAAWNLPPSIAAVIPSAFAGRVARLTFRTELRRLAETATVKVPLLDEEADFTPTPPRAPAARPTSTSQPGSPQRGRWKPPAP